jgi:hypothetical protein
MTARPFALERTDGGMTLSGPKACRGSTKLHATSQTHSAYTTREEEAYEARIRPTFLETFALAQCAYKQEKQFEVGGRGALLAFT